MINEAGTAAARRRVGGARHRAEIALPLALMGSLALALGVAPPAHATEKATAKATSKATPKTVTALKASKKAGHEHPARTETRASMAWSSSYTVVTGDTVSDIAARFGLSTAAVLARNGLSWKSLIFPGQVLDLAGPGSGERVAAPISRYTIEPGDTISEIAEAHGLRTADVLSANGLSPSSTIYPGQTIVLPDAQAGVVSSDAEAASTSGGNQAGAIRPDEAQAGHIRTIIAIGREVGAGERGILVALVAAMQESGLRNLDYGDRDSLGLFQQRPSTGWGSPQQILDPGNAVRSFFLGTAHAPGLLDIPRWQDMTVGDAAQAVQISAHPELYGRWSSSARNWLAEFG